MSSALHDYRQFITWLHTATPVANEDVRRFANLVLSNFDMLAGTSRNQSQRSVKLVELARRSFAEMGFAPPPPEGAAQEQSWAWTGLKSIKVGPFRGFRNAEEFDLTKRIVMFYGPNGSGKTSLCEALEFALLGVVDEAESKRIPADRYLANVHERRFDVPVLMAALRSGSSAQVMPDIEANRFLFVEKNRIDAFSRMAAKSTGQKTELIATLFGMDQFNDFVSHFNDSMDGQLKITSQKQQELQAKRAALSNDVAAIGNEAAVLAQLDAAEAQAANQYQNGLKYSEILALLGSPEVPGRLQQLNESLNAPFPVVYEVSSAELSARYHAAESAQVLLDKLRAELQNRQAQVSFKDLYLAVLALRKENSDKCPACETPLSGVQSVVRNPYDKAEGGLRELRELSELQDQIAKAASAVLEAGRALAVFLNVFAQKVAASAQSNDYLLQFLANPQVDHERAWWRDSLAVPEGGRSMAQRAIDYAVQLETADLAARAAIAGRQSLVHERDRLVQMQVVVATLAANRRQAMGTLSAAKARVAAFELANVELIDAVARESEQIANDVRIKHAYDAFLIKLRQYKSALPGTLMAGLNTLALELYNDFNRNDLDADKLAVLELPTTGTGRIDIAFRGAPDKKIDALHVLSEGHLRCLGLAILLAKALRINAPTIVFDDAVNAIDHEHREGIRETLFQGARFSGVQIIVTCHSNEFIKDIQNHVPSNECVSYSFRHHTGNNHPRVLRNVPSQNYLVIARQALERGDDRSALGASRQALEMLASKIWGWLGKYDQGLLTLKLGRAGEEPGLRNLCEALRTKLNSANSFVHADKETVISGLEFVLGIPATSHAWQYLNKGTHEEANRPDFDTRLVESIVVNLERLNALALRGPR